MPGLLAAEDPISVLHLDRIQAQKPELMNTVEKTCSD